MGSRVVVRADATPQIGSGHVVRLLGLVDELLDRSVAVELVGTVSIPWVRDLLDRRAVTPVDAPATAAGTARLCLDLGAGAAVLDGYDLPADLGATLRAAGLRVLSVRDGGFGAGQEADLVLDQNLGAQAAPVPGTTMLLGERYTLFRDEVLHATTAEWPGGEGTPRVLAFFGGSDPFGAAEVLTPVVLSAVQSVDLVVVTPDEDIARSLRGLPRTEAQHLTVSAPRPDLLSVARSADAVVTATGSSVWELLLHGVPFACVQVADNQEHGYRHLVGRGLTVGLGSLHDLRTRPAAVRTAAERTRLLLAGPSDAVRRGS